MSTTGNHVELLIRGRVVLVDAEDAEMVSRNGQSHYFGFYKDYEKALQVFQAALGEVNVR